jgi:Asp-tRNA(Asn)/Glu-tRNA(Gln) amidotransferase A subunit family amidase
MIPPTIQTASAQIRAGQRSPMDLLHACLEQIERYESQVHAWVLVDRERALKEAEERARELQAGQWRGPLHGIPLGIKDIIDVFDWPTAAGSNHWRNSVARQDATVVQRLRQAGAVLVGKTVTTQYASFDPPLTRNPWNKQRTPGGSSSGSAAGVACGMCLGALGSQTGGSITRPASYCGVAGCKPTWGRVSTHGVLPLAPSLDHVGPIARCVRDVALLLQTIAGWDARDPLSFEEQLPDLVRACESASEPPRLGRVRGLFEERAHPSVRQSMDEVCQRLREAGAIIEEVALPASFAEVIPRHRVVMAVEAAAFHRDRLRRHPEDYGPSISGLLEEGLKCPAPEYADCKEHQRMLKEEMNACFQELDALLTPATIDPAPGAATTGDPAFNSPWSYTGVPTVSFPVARSAEGLPLAIQLVAGPMQEALLFAVVCWCEERLAFELGEPPTQIM